MLGLEGLGPPQKKRRFEVRATKRRGRIVSTLYVVREVSRLGVARLR